MTLTSKPPWGTQVLENNVLRQIFQAFFDDLEEQLNDQILGEHLHLKIYTVATLPIVHNGGMIYVSDESGGAVPAFGDGTNWRRITDRAIVS